MKTMMQGWHLMRFVRLGLGLVILVQSITTKDMMVAFLGGLIVFTALANVGCCGSNGCGITTKSTKANTIIDTEYEEVR